MNPTPKSHPRPPGAGAVPAGWNRLPAEHMPVATFWPAGLALAVTFILWGVISSWVILAIGLGLIAASLAGWINDLRHERKPHA